MVNPNTCGYCNHTGEDVQKVGLYHVGGIGDVQLPLCDDGKACGDRVLTGRAALVPTWLQENKKESE